MKKIKEFLDKNLVVRYIISGGLASAVDIILFATMIKVFNFHYIPSVSISITVSFIIRFYLQKVFAFRDKNLDVHKQIVMYSILYVISMGLTYLLLYIFIDKLNIHYLISQILAIGIVACVCFFVYKHIIFKPHEFNKI